MSIENNSEFYEVTLVRGKKFKEGIMSGEQINSLIKKSQQAIDNNQEIEVTVNFGTGDDQEVFKVDDILVTSYSRKKLL